MKVIKRNGSETTFCEQKIANAIMKANHACKTRELSDRQIKEIVDYISYKCDKLNRAVSVEEIQDMVETELMNHGARDVARCYIKYRYERSLARKANTTDARILSIIDCENEEIKQENSNKNPTIISVQRDYMAGEVSKDLVRRFLFPENLMQAHDDGEIHIHDTDYISGRIHNCDLVNLEDMLQNGTVISEVLIEKPHRISTACNIASQIVAQVASSQFGGQSISLTHLAPFVDISRKEIREELEKELKETNITNITKEQKEIIVEKRLKTEVRNGIQTFNYQLVTLMTTNGQTPFVTVFMYLNEAKNEQEKKDLALLIEEMLHQRIKGLKNEKGVWITPAFPKLIYVLDEDNIKEDTPYFYLTELAAKCTAKRMVPDYISAKKMRELKKGNVYTCMGCRSFLTAEENVLNPDGSMKFYGRFNQGVVTINLVDVALSSGKDMKKFWKILEDRLELCHEALRLRHERLVGTPSDVAPILWQHGALARLKKGEVIDNLLYNGYSTISLGYAGLYEMCYYMTGKSHTNKDAKEFALSVMQKLNDKCAEWKQQENISYSVYGTPIESTTYKFAKNLQRKFGIIEGVTDHNYITNSYHVNVRENIDAFTKLAFESEFQELSPGGAISYVEVPNMQQNIPAIISVLQFIYDNIMYAELNTKSDYCMNCGFDGEIQIIEEDGKLDWECPNCGNRNHDTLSVARRTCGYIGSQFWNQGRTQEIKDRVLHL